MGRHMRAGVVVVAAGLVLSGCYGPFNLTRRLLSWNTQVGGKWEKEFVFLLLALTPVYGLAIAGDAMVFNSMEFWTGDNPVDPPRADVPQTKRLVRGETETLLSFSRSVDGPELILREFRKGEPTAYLRLADEHGVTIGRDADGRLLMAAHTEPDGGIVVHDAGGRAVASYSAEDVTRFLSTAPR